MYMVRELTTDLVSQTSGWGQAHGGSQAPYYRSSQHAGGSRSTTTLSAVTGFGGYYVDGHIPVARAISEGQGVGNRYDTGDINRGDAQVNASYEKQARPRAEGPFLHGGPEGGPTGGAEAPGRLLERDGQDVSGTVGRLGAVISWEAHVRPPSDVSDNSSSSARSCAERAHAAAQFPGERSQLPQHNEPGRPSSSAQPGGWRSGERRAESSAAGHHYPAGLPYGSEDAPVDSVRRATSQYSGQGVGRQRSIAPGASFRSSSAQDVGSVLRTSPVDGSGSVAMGGAGSNSGGPASAADQPPPPAAVTGTRGSRKARRARRTENAGSNAEAVDASSGPPSSMIHVWQLDTGLPVASGADVPQEEQPPPAAAGPQGEIRWRVCPFRPYIPKD